MVAFVDDDAYFFELFLGPAYNCTLCRTIRPITVLTFRIILSMFLCVCVRDVDVL